MNIIEKAKMLWSLYGAYGKAKEAGMKSGFKSTEFWTVTVIPMILGLWAQYSAVLPANFVAQVLAVLFVIYAVLRTLLKLAAILAPLTQNTVDDAVVEAGTKIEDAIDAAVKPKAL